MFYSMLHIYKNLLIIMEALAVWWLYKHNYLAGIEEHYYNKQNPLAGENNLSTFYNNYSTHYTVYYTVCVHV